MAHLVVTDGISIDESELVEAFVLASGPGGQNVNKVASAVQLRFDLRHSPSLPEDLRQRAERLAGSRLTKTGEIVIIGRRFRSQERNRMDARERLIELLKRAAEPPAKRWATAPPRASRRKRLDDKGSRGVLKKLRGRPRDE
ncbi:MAG TPA: alternative ribosome rescue aminoacyl-tRNA hydrolase ArfB [Rhizomicrobium sp.]